MMNIDNISVEYRNIVSNMNDVNMLLQRRESVRVNRCLAQFFPVHLNTYVMGLRPL